MPVNFGTGQGAFDADEWAIGRIALMELQAIFFKPAPNSFTRKEYPREPMYMLYQNQLMEEGMSNKARKELSMARYVHAKKARVGEPIICPGCGAEMLKTTYQHVYCKDKIRGRSNCKDFINNWFDPVRMEQAVRAWHTKHPRT